MPGTQEERLTLWRVAALAHFAASRIASHINWKIEVECSSGIEQLDEIRLGLDLAGYKVSRMLDPGQLMAVAAAPEIVGDIVVEMVAELERASREVPYCWTYVDEHGRRHITTDEERAKTWQANAELKQRVVTLYRHPPEKPDGDPTGTRP